jgi:hypothetical protein
MLRITRTIASSLTVLLVAGAMAPVAVNAMPFGKKSNPDATTAQGQVANIAVQVYNRGLVSQDLKVEGKVYTVPPHQALTIKATSGTAVYADSIGTGYQKGELLFKFAPAMNGATVKFN